MKAQNLAAQAALQPMADVALPQLWAFGDFSCQFRSLSATVHAGRTQAAFPSQEGAAQSTPPANKWSRGCRALKSPFWHCAWSLSWPLVPRKPKKWSMLTSRPSRPSRLTPANTSKTKGRALLGLTARPALFLSDASRAAASARTFLAARNRFAAVEGHAYGAATDNVAIWSIPCVPQPSSPSSRLPLLPLAPRKRLLSSRCQLTSLSSRPKPANTSDLSGRGFGPALPASVAFTSAQEVASC